MPKIKDIAKIQTGVYTRTSQNGNAVYLQMRYFNEQGELSSPTEPDLIIDKHLTRHLLKEGDVLFAAKGVKNFAAIFNASIGPAVASSSFFVIKVKQGILPEYLAWFLNHPRNQKKLKAGAKGTAMPSITLHSLAEIDINIPDLKTQRTILKIDRLRVQEKNIMYELTLLKDRLLENKILARI